MELIQTYWHVFALLAAAVVVVILFIVVHRKRIRLNREEAVEQPSEEFFEKEPDNQ